MTPRHFLPALLLALLPALPPAAAPLADRFALTDAYPGRRFTFPVGVLAAPHDARHLYVLERAGRVLRFARDGSGPVETVLDLRERVDSRAPEAGLLGMAFDPDWPRRPRVWLSYTAAGRDGAALESRLVRLTGRDGGRRLDPASERLVLRVAQPYRNHNGGHIAFGPDGYLYFGLGDGGAGGDPHGHAQRLDSLLGKLLRIDVRGADPYAVPPDNPFVGRRGARPEIWALGLRNPWRWSFDGQGRLWLGDVGQDRWEEIDRIERGANYGWNHREGRHCFRPRFGCRRRGLTDPVAEYGHDHGRCSVTGGFVYRGPRLPALRGRYLYGDFCSGELWALDPAAPQRPPLRLADTPVAIASFGEDADGELLVVEYAPRGRLLRLVRSPARP